MKLTSSLKVIFCLLSFRRKIRGDTKRSLKKRSKILCENVVSIDDFEAISQQNLKLEFEGWIRNSWREFGMSGVLVYTQRQRSVNKGSLIRPRHGCHLISKFYEAVRGVQSRLVRVNRTRGELLRKPHSAHAAIFSPQKVWQKLSNFRE